MIILDTNVVSETMKPVPEPRVIDWLNRQELSTLHLTTVSLAELRFGMARLEPGRRRDDFELRLERMLTEVFPGRVLGFDAAAANAFGALVALAERHGRTVSFLDGAIAAIAAANGYPVATRDVAPFIAMGVDVVDPWEPIPPGP